MLAAATVTFVRFLTLHSGKTLLPEPITRKTPRSIARTQARKL
jgi:hypothetical protein